ncbi:MAG: polysaccharide biosynthesis family protein [Herbinix sp.]|jgi:O-antigen/teichoic acid export membrane protein|nr:polysaccharide biosynthesis family protein [Herbinix sp.]
MNLFKKFIKYAFGNGVVLILGLLSSPIITRLISPVNMGKYSMFTTVTSLLSIITLFGFDQTFVRFYYEEEVECRGKLLRQCVKLPLQLSVLSFSFILVFYKFISKYVSNEETILIAIVLGIHVVGTTLNRFVLLQIRMEQKANTYSIINIITKISYLSLIGILYIIFYDSYWTVIIAFSLSNLIITIITMLKNAKVWFRFNKNIELSTKYNQMLKYSVPFIFSSSISWIFQSIDRIMLKQFTDYKEIGIYSGAMTIVSLLNIFQVAFSNFWVPVAYEKYKEDPDNYQFFALVNKIVTVIMIVIAVMIILFKDIVSILLGPEYREAIFVFPFLIMMPIMYTISETTVLGINFQKNSKMHIYISVIVALFNIAGNYILIPILGAKGAAISTGLAYIVFYICRSLISRHYFKFKYNIIKCLLSIFSLYGLAIYSSFHYFNIAYLLLALLAIIITLLLYYDITKMAVVKLNVLIRKSH